MKNGGNVQFWWHDAVANGKIFAALNLILPYRTSVIKHSSSNSGNWSTTFFKSILRSLFLFRKILNWLWSKMGKSTLKNGLFVLINNFPWEMFTVLLLFVLIFSYIDSTLLLWGSKVFQSCLVIWRMIVFFYAYNMAKLKFVLRMYSYIWFYCNKNYNVS